MKAEYANLLLEIPQVETKNVRIDLSLALPSFRTSTTEQLQAQTTYQQQVQFLENWILEIVNNSHSRVDHLVVSISKSIRRLKGLVNINTLAKDNYISLRQLERRFKNATGLTLKEYSNTVRFNIAAKAIKQYPEQDISEIAFNHGFHDLAHMSNTFKRISGQSPSTFR